MEFHGYKPGPLIILQDRYDNNTKQQSVERKHSPRQSGPSRSRKVIRVGSIRWATWFPISLLL